jgi:hypothetical protein
MMIAARPRALALRVRQPYFVPVTIIAAATGDSFVSTGTSAILRRTIVNTLLPNYESLSAVIQHRLMFGAGNP